MPGKEWGAWKRAGEANPLYFFRIFLATLTCIVEKKTPWLPPATLSVPTAALHASLTKAEGLERYQLNQGR